MRCCDVVIANSLSCVVLLQGEQVSVLEELVRGGARLTRAAHVLWAQIVRPGDFVVDATSGNGADTVWLARAVGPTGRVLAFDVQVCALGCQNLLRSFFEILPAMNL